MSNEWDYAYTEDDGSDEWLELNTDGGEAQHAIDLLEQENWEDTLDNDPGYHAWADDLERQAAEDRNIVALAEIESERNFNCLTAWD